MLRRAVMKIISVCPNSYFANTYLLICGDQALVVDPSLSLELIEKAIDKENATLCGIIVTHGHFDHTTSVDVIRNKYKVPLMIHSADAPMLTDGKINGFYDFFGRECVHRPAEKLLRDNDEIALGDETIKVISTPGHSPGSICLFCSDNGNPFLVTGDTIFASSIGRCDLWRGDEAEMALSLRKLSSFDHGITIYPGHSVSASLEDALVAARYYTDF